MSQQINSQICIYKNYNQSSMKYLTYFITFFAYVAVHVMRMSYSFNKSRIKQRYGIDPYFLGILDGIIYLAIGLGFFFRYKISRSHHLTKTYLVTALIVSVSFSVIPLLSLLNIGIDQSNQSGVLTKVFISLSLIIYGLFQFSFWPISLVLVNQYFDPKKQGTILGFWSANGDFGNIIGFFIPTLMVTILDGPWEISLLFGAAANAIMGVLIFTCLKMKQKNNSIITIDSQNLQKKQALLQNDQTFKNSTFSQFWQFTKLMFKNGSTCLYLVCTGLYKAILYGFLLWCPIFLESTGHKNFSGYIPMMFNASTLIGSVVLGKLYEQKTRANSKASQILKTYKLFIASLLLFFTLVLFNLSGNNIVFYGILSFLMGFTLGGIFNMLVTHQIIVFTKGQTKKTDLMSTLAMSFGNISVGILELIVALALHKDNKGPHNKDSYGVVFIILLITSAIATLLTFIRIRLNSSNDKKLLAKIQKDEKFWNENPQSYQKNRQSYEKIDM